MSKNFRYFRKLVLLVVLSVFLLFTGCGRSGREIVPARETAGGLGTAEETTLSEPESQEVSEPESENRSAEEENIHNEETVVVHVCGAVNSPGIYTLPEGSRLWKAVEAAGGVTEDGAGDYLNMAAPVTDGEKVVVPFLADVEEPFGEAETLSSQTGNDAAGAGGIAGNGIKEAGDSKGAAGLVDLNTATMEQLMTLPGIGESKAKAILEYRENTGPFTVPQDITNVPGIKEGSYEKLKSYITV